MIDIDVNAEKIENKKNLSLVKKTTNKIIYLKGNKKANSEQNSTEDLEQIRNSKEKLDLLKKIIRCWDPEEFEKYKKNNNLVGIKDVMDYRIDLLLKNKKKFTKEEMIIFYNYIFENFVGKKRDYMNEAKDKIYSYEKKFN